MDCETYTLAPSIVVAKARKLADVGLYSQALEMLERNCVAAHVYPTHVEMSVSRPATPASRRKRHTAAMRQQIQRQ